MAQDTCKIAGCGGSVTARGWCPKHYTRWKRHGDPEFRIPGEVLDGRRICPQCRQDKLLADYSGVHNRTCKSCLAARKRSAPRPELVPLPEIFCVECGTQFVPRTKYQISCGTECSDARKRRFDRGYMELRDRELANASGRRWYANNKSRAYDSKAMYRARKAAAYVEDVDRLVIFERDRWTCLLCGKPIDRDAHFPDPLTPSVDHRVPLSRGGDHSYDNCQTAHLGCNARKGNRAS